MAKQIKREDIVDTDTIQKALLETAEAIQKVIDAFNSICEKGKSIAKQV